WTMLTENVITAGICERRNRVQRSVCSSNPDPLLSALPPKADIRINRRGVVRHYVSVNYTESIRDWALDHSFENFLGRFGAQFGNRIHPHRLGEFDTVLFTNLQGLWPERGNRGERAPALADCTREQALSQW